MKHLPSSADLEFRDDFERGEFQFPLGHRAHVRLAYIYLTEHGVRRATAKVRESIQNFFCYRGIDEGQYNETLTLAWMMAVRHSMEGAAAAESSECFFEQNPKILDSNSMLDHYSSALLFSDGAREVFAAPDREPIPRYDD